MGQETLRVVGTHWPPYNNISADANLPGFQYEILAAVLKAEGKTFKYVEQPWDRVVKAVTEGDADVILGAGKSDVPTAVFPKENLGNAINAFFVKKDSTWTYTGVPSLSGILMGIASGNHVGDEIDSYVAANDKDKKKIDLGFGDNYMEVGFNKLAAGRISTFIDDRNSILWYLKTIGKGDQFKEAGHLDAVSNYVAFSGKYAGAKDLAAQFDLRVAELRKSGELAKILKKYGLTDWK